MGLKTLGNLISAAAKRLKRKQPPPDLDALAEGKEEWVDVVATPKKNSKQRRAEAKAEATEVAVAAAAAAAKAEFSGFEEAEDVANEMELVAEETANKEKEK